MSALLRSRPGSRWLRLGVLIALLCCAAGSLLLWDPADVLAAAAGPWRVPIVLAVYTLGTVAFVPRPALNTATGLLLGAVQGIPVAVAASTVGAAVAFGLGRSLGRDALRPMLRHRLFERLDRRITEQGFRTALLLRLIPGPPFQAVNYACAVSGVGYRPFVAATAIGVVPNTAAYVTAGASAGSPTSPAFLASAAVIALMSLFSVYSLWKARAAARTRKGVGAREGVGAVAVPATGAEAVNAGA
ncbi:TVP38/TMEM64 family protein [Kitasatospora camelliae]|uniref:TVP38/TMEM64 family membrane protein n=1 Tax=Kitasatospora camelliae TaxID=3156397 RepID=A0AAU8JRL9_9ACTN